MDLLENFVILLGTKGGPAIRPGSAMPTASLLCLAGQRILVDCGLGVTRALVEAGMELRDLRCVFVTHLHSDHYLELGPLLHTAWTAGLGTPVTVWGPEGLQRYWDFFLASMQADINLRIEDEGRPDLRGLVRIATIGADDVAPSGGGEVSPGRRDKDTAIGAGNVTAGDAGDVGPIAGGAADAGNVAPIGAGDVAPSGGGDVAPGPRDKGTAIGAGAHASTGEFAVATVGPVVVSALRNRHPPLKDSFALSFRTASRHVVFSGDTAPIPEMADFSRGADLLVHEAMLEPALAALVARVGNGDDRLLRHLSRSHTLAADAGRIARDAGVGALALNHLIPSDDPEFTQADWRAAVDPQWEGPLHLGRDGLRIDLPPG